MFNDVKESSFREQNFESSNFRYKDEIVASLLATLSKTFSLPLVYLKSKEFFSYQMIKIFPATGSKSNFDWVASLKHSLPFNVICGWFKRRVLNALVRIDHWSIHVVFFVTYQYHVTDWIRNLSAVFCVLLYHASVFSSFCTFLDYFIFISN